MRERVYQALRERGPLRRIDLIRCVASLMHVPADERMEGRIDKILLNRADRRLRRIGRGMYDYVAEANDGRRHTQA